MTNLQVRRIDFDFDGEVPFVWNEHNPAFSLNMNATSVIAVAFEKFIVAAVREAMPLIIDPAAAAEAEAFLFQEAEHSAAHRRHLAALTRTYPGIQSVLDAAIASFDHLTETRSLAWRLGYVADVEATFTPSFKLILDHQDSLFSAGDERVASLFLWHFVEEVEHRASGLIVYDAVVDSGWYRVRILPAVAKHMLSVIAEIAEGFNAHVPAEDRLVDARILTTSYGVKQGLRSVLRRGDKPTGPVVPSGFATIPRRDKLRAFGRILLTQLPAHDPEHEPLPAFADQWFAHFDEGGDAAHWYSSTAPGAAIRRPSKSGFHDLRVGAIQRLTADSVAITFDVPAHLADLYRFEQGQHVTVRAEVDGADVRRTYSLSTPASSDVLRIGVKKVPGGAFSTFAVKSLEVGDHLQVSTPAGLFQTPLDPRHARHYAAVAGGSGITPLLSILATTLEQEPSSRFTLVYANRDALSVMFADDLLALEERYPDRLRVVHVLEDSDGRVDRAKLDGWIADHTLADVDTWFLCGPTAMADILKADLAALDVAESDVLCEAFTPGAPAPTVDDGSHPDARLTFTLDGETVSTQVAGQTLLEAALETGRDVPFSCQAGLCGTCRVRLCEGTVDMANNEVLRASELADGYILMCQSRPTSEQVAVDYDLGPA